MKNILLIYGLLASVLGYSQNVELVVKTNKDSIGTEDIVVVTFSINTTSQVQFYLNEIPDFEIISNQSSTSISIINDVKTEEQSWVYYLKPDRVGVFQIENINLSQENTTYTFEPLEIVVLDVPTYGESKVDLRKNYYHFSNPYTLPKRKKTPNQTPAKRKHQTKRL